jgi:hypothetical protein
MRGCSPCSGRRLKEAWRVVEGRIGRAGGVKQRTARQRAWDQKYGEGQWAVGCVVGGAFVLQEYALKSIYNRSYEEHFAAHPEGSEDPSTSTTTCTA